MATVSHLMSQTQQTPKSRQLTTLRRGSIAARMASPVMWPTHTQRAYRCIPPSRTSKPWRADARA